MKDDNLCSACLRDGDVVAVRGAALRTYSALCGTRGGAVLCAPCGRLLRVAHAFAAQVTRAQSVLRKYNQGELKSLTLTEEVASLNPLSKLSVVHNVVENFNYYEVKHESDNEGGSVARSDAGRIKHEPCTERKHTDTEQNASDTEGTRMDTERRRKDTGRRRNNTERRRTGTERSASDTDGNVQPWFSDVNDDNVDDDFNDVMLSSLGSEVKLTNTDDKELVQFDETAIPFKKKSVKNLKKVKTKDKDYKNLVTAKHKSSATSQKITTERNSQNKIADDEKITCQRKQIQSAKRKKKSQQTISNQNNNLNLKKFMKINSLTVDEQSEALNQKKLSYAYQKAEFKCDMCFRTFGAKSGYESHMFRHTDKFGEYRCAVCHLHFQYKNKLSTHMNIHMYAYNCKECTFKSSFRNSAIAHIASHEGKQYSCDLCTLTFDHKSTYLCHVRRLHPSSHLCQLCGNCFISQYGLKIHKLMVHRVDSDDIPEDGPLCVQCNTKFIDETAFMKHIKVTTCTANDPKYSARKAYPERRRLQCEVCSKELRTYPQYEQHFMREHPEAVGAQRRPRRGTLCDQCGRIFHCASVLEDHMSIHRAKGEKTFKCDKCGRGYLTQARLKLHQIVHSGIRYPCQICGREFTLQSNRDRHFKYVHTSEKNVKCVHCEKMFKNEELRKAHEAYVHLNRPYPKRDRRRERERRKCSREVEGED